MKPRKVMLWTALLLLISISIVSVFYLTDRKAETEGYLQIEHEGMTDHISAEDILISEIEAKIVNGKGEIKDISAKGIYADDLLAGYDGEYFTAISDDAYTAEIYRDEWAKACIIEEESHFKLIVIGDPDSKRAVKHLIRLELK